MKAAFLAVFTALPVGAKTGKNGTTAGLSRVDGDIGPGGPTESREEKMSRKEASSFAAPLSAEEYARSERYLTARIPDMAGDKRKGAHLAAIVFSWALRWSLDAMVDEYARIHALPEPLPVRMVVKHKSPDVEGNFVEWLVSEYAALRDVYGVVEHPRTMFVDSGELRSDNPVFRHLPPEQRNVRDFERVGGGLCFDCGGKDARLNQHGRPENATDSKVSSLGCVLAGALPYLADLIPLLPMIVGIDQQDRFGTRLGWGGRTSLKVLVSGANYIALQKPRIEDREKVWHELAELLAVAFRHADLRLTNRGGHEQKWNLLNGEETNYQTYLRLIRFLEEEQAPSFDFAVIGKRIRDPRTRSWFQARCEESAEAVREEERLAKNAWEKLGEEAFVVRHNVQTSTRRLVDGEAVWDDVVHPRLYLGFVCTSSLVAGAQGRHQANLREAAASSQGRARSANVILQIFDETREGVLFSITTSGVDITHLWEPLCEAVIRNSGWKRVHPEDTHALWAADSATGEVAQVMYRAEFRTLMGNRFLTNQSMVPAKILATELFQIVCAGFPEAYVTVELESAGCAQ